MSLGTISNQINCGRFLISREIPRCLRLWADYIATFSPDAEKIGREHLQKPFERHQTHYEKALSAYVWSAKNGKEHYLHLLYRSLPTLPALNVFLMTDNLWDGAGDYFSALNSARALKERLPADSKIQVFVHHAKPLPPVNLRQFHLQNDEIYRLQRESAELEPFQMAVSKGTDNPLFERCRQADITITVPMNVFMDGGWAPDPATKALHCFHSLFQWAPKLHVEEYSQMDSRPRPLFTHCYDFHAAMGLGTLLKSEEPNVNQEVTEHGIFLPDATERPCENQALETLLQSPNMPFFCYHSYASVEFWKHVIINGSELSEIIIISKARPIEEIQSILKAMPIKQVVLMKDGQKEVFEFQKKGPIVKVYDLFPLSNADFVQAIKRSRPIVGCTGDNSLSLALAAGKVPVYETISHKRPSWENLGKLARAWGINAVTDLKQPLHDALITPKARLGFHHLSSIISRYHCIDDHFPALIQRTFFRACFPNWKATEQTLMEALPLHEELVKKHLFLGHMIIQQAFDRRKEALRVVPELKRGFTPRFLFHYLLEDLPKLDLPQTPKPSIRTTASLFF